MIIFYTLATRGVFHTLEMPIMVSVGSHTVWPTECTRQNVRWNHGKHTNEDKEPNRSHSLFPFVSRLRRHQFHNGEEIDASTWVSRSKGTHRRRKLKTWQEKLHMTTSMMVTTTMAQWTECHKDMTIFFVLFGFSAFIHLLLISASSFPLSFRMAASSRRHCH